MVSPAHATTPQFTLNIETLRRASSYSLSWNSGKCTWSSRANPRGTQKVATTVCSDLWIRYRALLENPPLGDMVTPHLNMAEIQWESGKSKWRRTIVVQENRECDEKGVCREPDLNALFPIFKLVLTLAKSPEDHPSAAGH